jgi:hypothetical protein
MAKVKPETAKSKPANDGDLEFPIEEVGDEAANSTAVTTGGGDAVGALTGAISKQDIPIPIIGIAYGVGELGKTFTPGSLVLDKEHLLVEKTVPLNVIVVTANVYWKEYLDNAAFQAGIQPRSFQTAEEVRENGGTTEYDEAGIGSKPSFKNAMLMKMLIELPEGVDCYYFNTDLFGKKYAPARWYIDKTAYKRRGGKGVGVEIVKQAGFALADRGLLAGKWAVTTGYEKMGNNDVIAPSIKLIGQYTDEEMAEIKAVVGG